MFYRPSKLLWKFGAWQPMCNNNWRLQQIFFCSFFIQNKSFIDRNLITNQGWETLSKYKGWLKIEEKSNKSNKIATLIKDDTRTCTKYSNNVYLERGKTFLTKESICMALHLANQSATWFTKWGTNRRKNPSC